MQSSHKHVYLHLNNMTSGRKNNQHLSALHDSVHSLPGQDVKFKLPLVESLSTRHIHAKTQLPLFFPSLLLIFMVHKGREDLTATEPFSAQKSY